MATTMELQWTIKQGGKKKVLLLVLAGPVSTERSGVHSITNVIFQLGLSSNTCHNVSTQLRKKSAKTTDQDFISRNCPMKSAQTCHLKSRGQVTPRHSFLELRESASSSQTSLESVPVMQYVSFLGSQIKVVHASF